MNEGSSKAEAKREPHASKVPSACSAEQSGRVGGPTADGEKAMAIEAHTTAKV